MNDKLHSYTGSSFLMIIPVSKFDGSKVKLLIEDHNIWIHVFVLFFTQMLYRQLRVTSIHSGIIIQYIDPYNNPSPRNQFSYI